MSANPRVSRAALAVGLLTALITAGLGAPLPAAAALPPAQSPAPSATINVNGTTCTLAQAITAANTDAPVGGCPAGSGADVLALPANAVFTLAAADNHTVQGANGLPVIASPITINGNGAQIVRGAQAPAFRLLQVSAAGALTLNNLTLSNGATSADAGLGSGAGGALYAQGPVSLTNVSLTSNSALFTGGALELLAGGQIAGSLFSGNRVLFSTTGGALEILTGSLSLTDVTFINNSSVGSGGAVAAWSGPVTIAGGAFISNTAGYDSGALEANGITLTVANTSFSRNTAGGSNGGAIDLFGATAQISGSTFNNNSAVGGGAIANNFSSALQLTNDTFSGNTATAYGGGLENADSQAALTNVTLDGNSSPQGGALIQNAYHSARALTLTNTIVSNSPAGGDCYVYPGSALSITSSDHNLASDTSCAAYFTQPHDQNHAAPQLGLLQNNGGPTWTMLPAAASPAVDHGGLVCPATDQRGVARPQNSLCDIGAVERRANEIVTRYLYLPLVRR